MTVKIEINRIMQKPPLSKDGDYSKLQAKWNNMEEHGDATKMAELLRVCIVLPEGQSLIPSNWEDHSLLRPQLQGIWPPQILMCKHT